MTDWYCHQYSHIVSVANTFERYCPPSVLVVITYTQIWILSWDQTSFLTKPLQPKLSFILLVSHLRGGSELRATSSLQYMNLNLDISSVSTAAKVCSYIMFIMFHILFIKFNILSFGWVPDWKKVEPCSGSLLSWKNILFFFQMEALKGELWYILSFCIGAARKNRYCTFLSLLLLRYKNIKGIKYKFMYILYRKGTN